MAHFPIDVLVKKILFCMWINMVYIIGTQI